MHLLKLVHDAEALAEAVRKAVDPNGSGGKKITKEEWKPIIDASAKLALDIAAAVIG